MITRAFRLLALARPYWPWLALAVFLALVATLASVALLAVSGWFIAAMGLAGATHAIINYFTPAAVIRALAITRTGGRYAERVVGHEATLRLVAALRVWLFGRLEPLAPSGLAALRSGEVLARLRSDVDRLEAIFLRLVSPALVALVGAWLVVAVMAAFSPSLASVELALLVAAGVVVPWLVARRATASGRRIAETGGQLDAMFVDTVEGLAELQAHGAMSSRAEHIARLSDALIVDETRLADGTALLQGTLTLAAGLALVAALIVGAPAVAQGALQPALLVMLALLGAAGFELLAPLPLAIQSLSATLASARRIADLAERRPVLPDPADPEPLPADGRLSFEHVSLTYPGGRRPALSGVDLELEPGRRIAVLGASGSGKSSLVSLAARFVQPSSGRVSFAGVDVARLAGAQVRARLAVVEQRGHLFAASIRDNLRVARPQASEAELEEACRIAQIHEFISVLPRRYDTFIGNHGMELSGGEARRIVVARALLVPAPLLLLDEPTEGLDRATARALIAAVVAARREAGILLITHRPEALELMDEIVVLDQGRVIGRGTPAQVLPRIVYPSPLDTAID